ncbi:MAG: CotH kinase family protein [Planctomycetota bacterium]|nr:CotH kinase family protein [Planctomycetota bacterium]
MFAPSCCRLLTCLVLGLGSVLAAQTPDPLFDKSRLRDLYFTFKQTNWWAQVLASANTRTPVQCDLRIDNVTYPGVGLHIKGNSSRAVNTRKLPFNVILDAFNPGQELYGYSTINLNNAFIDPTFTREVLTYDLMARYLPSPQTAFARVYMNGQYWGVYILIEQPNKDFLRHFYRDDEGGRFKGDPPTGPNVDTSTFEYRGTTASVNHPHYTLKSSDPKAWDQLLNLTIKLNRSSAANLRRNIEQVINVDRTLWYLATHNVIHNLDSYLGAGRNFHFYIDPDTGLMNMIPWDENMAFGSYLGGPTPWTLPLFHNLTWPNRPLVKVLLGIGAYKHRYLAHVRTLLDESYQWDAVMKTSNDRYQNMIDAAVQADPNRQFPYADFRGNLTKDVTGSMFGVLHAMKPLVDRRHAFLSQHPQINVPTPQITEVVYPRSVAVPGQTVWVQAKVTATVGVKKVTLHTTDVLHSSYSLTPMFDDGLHHDGKANDGVYGGSFPAAPAFKTRYFYLRANATNFSVRFHPRRPEFAPRTLRTLPVRSTGPVLINELLADNDNGDLDSKGEAEDWLELLNTSAADYDLSGHYLTDDIAEPKKWEFPANTKILAGGFLRIWCDNEPGDGPLHASFKLSDEGEEVFLIDTDARGNLALDGIVFARQKSDRSYGNVPDGGPHIYYLWEPSGGAPVTGTGPGKVVPMDRRRTGSPGGTDLRSSSLPKVGNTLDLQIDGGTPRGVGILGVSVGVGVWDFGPIGPLMLDPAAMVLAPVTLDANGASRIRTPALPANTAGVTVYVQALVQEFTNALAIRVSK